MEGDMANQNEGMEQENQWGAEMEVIHQGIKFTLTLPLVAS